MIAFRTIVAALVFFTALPALAQCPAPDGPQAPYLPLSDYVIRLSARDLIELQALIDAQGPSHSDALWAAIAAMSVQVGQQNATAAKAAK